MSRSVKDLRELICVSRLTYRPSSGESDYSSDDSRLAASCSSLSLTDNNHKGAKNNISPDSGCVTNTSTETPTPNDPPKPTTSTEHRKTKRRKKRKQRSVAAISPFSDSPSLSKCAVIPPVNSSPHSSTNSLYSRDEDESRSKQTNFDHLLTFADTTIIMSWLSRSNDLVSYLSIFCNHAENYVRFAKFWLTEFPDTKKYEIYDLEFNILVDELTLAFCSGLTSKDISHTDLMNLLRALFKEYPGQLLTSSGHFLFLDYLDVLSSSRTAEYKKLLSDVRCSTQNKQHAQWLLAIRAFSLLNVWSAVVKFYISFTRCTIPAAVSTTSPDKDNIHVHHMLQAIRLGYCPVINYLFKSGRVHPQATDSNGKTWIFHAVIGDKMSVLIYLLTKPSPHINETSNTGNTALHAGANTGNDKAVRLLTHNQFIDIDVRNPQCDGATPLHLAVMHGHTDVVRVLLDAGADIEANMGDMCLTDIAETFADDEMIELIHQYTR